LKRAAPTCHMINSSAVRHKSGGLRQPFLHRHKRRSGRGQEGRQKQPAPDCANPSTGSRAATGPWNWQMRSSTPATRRTTSVPVPAEMKLRGQSGDNRQEVYGATAFPGCLIGSQGQDAGKRSPVRRLRHHEVKTHLSLSHDPTLKGVPKG